MKFSVFAKVSTVLVLLVALSGFACSTNTIAAIDAVVISAEGVIPFIPNLSASDSNLATGYLNSALTITGDLTACGATAACVTVAAADFQNLVLPTLSNSVSPQVVGLLNAVASAISKFISLYPPTAKGKLKAQKSSIQLSPSEKAKIAQINLRVAAAKAKLKRK